MNIGTSRRANWRLAPATLIIATCIIASGIPVARAQTELPEVIVTAQKRKQSEESVGVTMSALTATDLGKLNLGETREVGLSVPNVEVNYGAGMVNYNIRGIGVNFFATNLDPPVATYLDGVYLSKVYMAEFVPFDLARVEVLKGPQGTLNGSNTTGGSVNFYSQPPTANFESGLTVSYGNYGHKHLEAYVSGPVFGEVRARLSGFVDDQSKGFYWNVTRNTDEGKPKRGAARGQLEWKGSGTTVLAELNFGRDESERNPYQGVGIVTPASLAAGSPQFCPEYLNGTVTGATPDCVRATDGRNPGTANPFVSTDIKPNLANNTAIGGSLRIDHDYQNFTLNSLTGYQTFQRAEQEDSDGSPLYTVDAFWYQNLNQLTQEVRLISAGDMRWNYVFGAFYEHDHLTNGDYLSVANGASPGYYSPFEQTVDAAALYMHNDIRLTHTVSGVVGLRYDSERTAIDGGTYAATGIQSDGTRVTPTTLLVPLALSNLLTDGGRRTDRNVSWKLGLEWRPRLSGTIFNDALLYANASTGFRSGGFNADFAALQAAFTTLSPEKITAYETGFKTTFAHRALLVNGAVFHYDYRNGFINVDSATVPVPITMNAGKIKTNGAELDVHWRPIAGLEIKTSGGWLDSRIDSAITSGGVSIDGNAPVNSPKTTASGQVSYDFPLAQRMHLVLSTDVNWRASQYLYVPNDPANRESPYSLWNAIATLQGPSDRWSVSAWGRNLSDTFYRTYVNDLRGFGWLLNVWGQPRTYGVTVRVKL